MLGTEKKLSKKTSNHVCNNKSSFFFFDPQVGFMSKICANSRLGTDSYLNTDLWHHEHLTGGLRAASGRHDGVAFIPDDGGSQEAAMVAVESMLTPEHPMVLFCNRAPFP